MRGLPYVLVYEDDSDILPRLRILLKGLLDLSRVGLAVDNEEVPLRRGAGGHMLSGLDVSGDAASFVGLCVAFIGRSRGMGDIVHLCQRGGDR